jgi:hypothetical protein
MFRPIPSFERYEISDDGHVRRNGRILKPWYRGKYLRVQLCRDGIQHTRSVHILVLETFVGPRPADKPEGCHDNGVHDDNRVENLYWGTHQDNMLDKVRHGTHHNAAKTHCWRGHEFTPQNTRVRTQGTWIIRRCRKCEAINAREWRERRSA